MADTNDSIPIRVAVLEQMARNTEAALIDIRSELRSQRSDTQTLGNSLRSETRTQFHWLLGIIIVVLLAQGALWQQVGRLNGQMTAIGAQVGEIAAMLHQRAGG